MKDHAPAALAVVIPLFNQARHVERCLVSVLAQELSPAEILVVDDGSTDGGADAAARVLGSRGRVVTQRNQGVSAARNAGLRLTSSPLVAFLDSDDYWDPGFTSSIADLVSSFPEAAAYVTGYRQVFENGLDVEVAIAGAAPELVRDYFVRAVIGQFVWTGCTVVPRAQLEAVGGFAVGVAHGEDLDLWARLALRGPFACSPRILSNYRVAATAAAPRYARLPIRLQVVESILPVAESGLRPAREASEIRRYLQGVVRDAAFMTMRAGSVSSVRRLMDEPRNASLAPWLAAGSRTAPGRWLLRVAAFVRMATGSRRFIALFRSWRSHSAVSIRLGRRA